MVEFVPRLGPLIRQSGVGRAVAGGLGHGQESDTVQAGQNDLNRTEPTGQQANDRASR